MGVLDAFKFQKTEIVNMNVIIDRSNRIGNANSNNDDFYRSILHHRCCPWNFLVLSLSKQPADGLTRANPGNSQWKLLTSTAEKTFDPILSLKTFLKFLLENR